MGSIRVLMTVQWVYEIVSVKRDLAHTSSMHNRNETLALKCMANYKFSALQLHSGSQYDGHFKLLENQNLKS